MCASEVPPPCSRQVVPGCSLSRGEESQPVACLGHRLAGTLEHSGGFGQALLRVGRSERGWRGERDGERGCVIIAGRGWRAALDKGQQVWRRLVWWRRVGGRVSHPGDPDWMEQPRARALTQHEHRGHENNTPKLHRTFRQAGCKRSLRSYFFALEFILNLSYLARSRHDPSGRYQPRFCHSRAPATRAAARPPRHAPRARAADPQGART